VRCHCGCALGTRPVSAAPARLPTAARHAVPRSWAVGYLTPYDTAVRIPVRGTAEPRSSQLLLIRRRVFESCLRSRTSDPYRDSLRPHFLLLPAGQQQVGNPLQNPSPSRGGWRGGQWPPRERRTRWRASATRPPGSPLGGLGAHSAGAILAAEPRPSLVPRSRAAAEIFSSSCKLVLDHAWPWRAPGACSSPSEFSNSHRPATFSHTQKIELRE
jgi:hypothetical protein